jgi:hypothetical protein
MTLLSWTRSTIEGTSPRDFFAVAIRPRTYSNLAYLLLAVPLGIVYFALFVTGFALGIGLVPVLIGVPLLLAMVITGYWLAAFEREMATRLLAVEIPTPEREIVGSGAWATARSYLLAPVTWTGLVYLFAKFLLGIASFVLVVTLGSLTAVLIGAPLYYGEPSATLFQATNLPGPYVFVWPIDTVPEALVVSGLGLLVGLLSLHVLNAAAWASGQFARLLLGHEWLASIRYRE